jgi:transcription elongation factor
LQEVDQKFPICYNTCIETKKVFEMKTDLRAKPVTVVKEGSKHLFGTRNEASIFLFNDIEKESLDSLMRNPTDTEQAFYTFTEDFVEFQTRTASLMFSQQGA